MNKIPGKNKLFLIGIFLLGIAAGIFISQTNILKVWGLDVHHKCHKKRIHFKNPETHLVRPLLFCEDEQGGGPQLESMEKSISKYIDCNVRNDNAVSISVYYRDFNGGEWFGINEDENYDIASLLKVPLMIVYLKEAEKNPAILSSKIKCETIPGIAAHNETLAKEFSVKELIGEMIVHSDNVASAALLKNIGLEAFGDLFASLELPFIDLTKSEFTMSPADFATFFRVLYNATYLNTEMSEKALTLLSQTDFRHGIVTGVPKGVTVAHKYGKRLLTTGGEELHDCGIVYFPKSPYLICIMAKGRDYPTLRKIIKDISEMAYEHHSRGKGRFALLWSS